MNPVRQAEITKKEILLFLAQHKQLFKEKFDVDNIMLFGSYARGEATTSSDIDILIESDKKDLDKMLDLKDFLEKKFKKKVDLMYRDAVRRFILRSIEKDMIYA